MAPAPAGRALNVRPDIAACQLSAGAATVDPMPGIAGQVVILTVSDADGSAAWYCDLLGMDETSRYVQPDGHVALVHLAERFSGVELCLVDHRSGQLEFFWR